MLKNTTKPSTKIVNFMSPKVMGMALGRGQIEHVVLKFFTFTGTEFNI